MHQLSVFVIAVLIVFNIVPPETRCFNFEPRLPILKQGPVDSYFGYSVAEHIIVDRSVREPMILVGAPRASAMILNTTHSGIVYKCPFTFLSGDCTEILIDYKLNEKQPEGTDKQDQWLGVVVKSLGPGDKVIVCAHRYVLKGNDYRWGQGVCYSLTQFFDLHRVWEPCFNKPVKRAHEEFGFCQAGTSADVSSKRDLIFGTPGLYTWRGTLFTNSIDFDIKDDKTWKHGPLVETDSPVDKYSYLGMSVTSGKFFGDHISYIGGAPRSNGTGQVVFFAKQKKGSDFIVEMILSGQQFGSQFGYTILALDLNNDKKDDFIVGAPFFYNGTRGIGGVVYVYHNRGKGITQNPDFILTGIPSENLEARFGFSLANLGDINKDNYPDLAIGAPYDDGGGAVYIYLGSKDGLNPKPVQVIRGSDISWTNEKTYFDRYGLARPLQTFGYSLSGSVDMDNNGIPDLVIGCYESDAVVLLRTRPIVDVNVDVTGTLRGIDPTRRTCVYEPSVQASCFQVKVCIKSDQLSPSSKLKYTIEAETFQSQKKPIIPRVKFFSAIDSDTPHITTRQIESPARYSLTCKDEVVILRESGDFHRSVKFKLNLEIDMPEFPSQPPRQPISMDSYPILNQVKAVKYFEASFVKSCVDGDVCKSDLRVRASIKRIKDTKESVIYLGSDEVNLEVTVDNENEPAYDAYLYISHPDSTFTGRTKIEEAKDDIRCKPVNETLTSCFLGQPFTKGTARFTLSFDSEDIPDAVSKLKFRVFANTTSSDLSRGRSSKEIEVDVVRRADLEIRGASFPSSVWYGGDVVGESAMVDAEDVGSQVTHSYTILSHGPYFPKELIVDIDWPYSIATKQGEGKWILYLMKAIVIGGGQCYADAGIINPLGLRDLGLEQPIPSAPIKSRAKRQSKAPVKKIVEDGKSQNIVVLDCRPGVATARCHRIRCYAENIRPGQSATIMLTGRLWNSTFVEDYATDVNQVQIISRAKLALAPSIRQNRTSDDVHFAMTKAYPDLPLLPSYRVPLLIIIMAILLGVLLLILLTVLLWKCGFFIRRKPGYMAAPLDDKDYGY